MALIIFFFAAGMFAYWLVRFWVLAFGDEAEIEDMLDGDWERLRMARMLLRMLFGSPRTTL
jgi:hypothetical protein